MAIRSTIKSVVIKENKILLIKYLSKNNLFYYELPGGGQNQYESMEEAARREFLEETGYKINLKNFAAIAEEIFEDQELRDKYPNYVHRIHHIFQAELISDENDGKIETDKYQTAVEWIPVEQVKEINLYPKQLKENFLEVLYAEIPLYLGTVYMKQTYY